ncbi:asparagine synthase [Nitrosopumilus sp. K4]|uniref:asparagine synthase C-terminal domain-containing protein n=1 Tax=Nitrosopumilus sp. K4 TaxID=2795383 RepID=UPI001BAE4E6C|nr:asparagine synthase C-terminal domain-containing protein [Nitrosopumilus sp. K4]QUC64893.1 asparagine synthase [Nitrosopumilus sp. K4]
MNETRKDLLEHIKDSIVNAVTEKKIAVAFSGGVDSTLVAKVCSDLGYDVTLVTIGFPESHDILFAKEVNQKLKFKHEILEIESNSFGQIATKINQKIKTENLSWNENSIAFYYVSKLAKSLSLDVVVTANGIDELFCGYNAYREAISGGESKVLEVMNAKLDNEIKMMKAVNSVTAEFGVVIVQPLLSEKFVEFAKTIPISEKIHDSEDLYRKHIIRKLASEVGVPEISYNKRKKALQYGSKIHKSLLKTR